MGIFKRKGKNIVELDKSLIKAPFVPEEYAEQKERVVRKIIDGKLYDISKAEKICSVVVPEAEIPENRLCFCSLLGQEVIIYHGNMEYFICYYSYLQPVSEEWVKKWLGEQNVEKYIELFGGPELA